MQNNDITNATSAGCSLCHSVPDNYKDSGHLDETDNAEILFNVFVTDSGNVASTWNHSTASCNNTYCHGAFKFDKDASSNQWVYLDSVIIGNNPEMIWTNVGTGQADCGSCHGLPPTGHGDYTTCHTCHIGVVDADRNIIDKSKHINGKIDIF